MPTLEWSLDRIEDETAKIIAFVAEGLSTGDQPEKGVVAVSGGLDSDVCARMVARAVGPERLKLFIVIQEGLDPRHLTNARMLALDLVIPLVEVGLSEVPFGLIRALCAADPTERFRPDGLLDPSRAKCSVRTAVLSTYVDRGYIVIGTSNRTELETGFFLPLGDGLGHLKPIVHLYKSQVRQLAKHAGTREEVINQPASSGFWIGAEDLEDMAFWLFNEAPIAEQRTFSPSALALVQEIRGHLTTERLDLALLGLSYGQGDVEVAHASGLPAEIVRRLRRLTAAAARFKRRPLGLRLENAT
jgi:NAD+ synthase